MKDVTVDYIAKEEAQARKPVELYKIWVGSAFQYFTNGDVAVTYPVGGDVYAPATISRGTAEYNSSLDVHTMKVQFASIAEPIVKYIAQNPVEVAWIEISRLFRDQDPYEKVVIFLGQIKTVSFKGLAGEVECVGFEHFLRMSIPRWRFQINCNHQVFDAYCTLAAGSFGIPAIVTLDATKTILTSATFGLADDGYYTGGLCVLYELMTLDVAPGGAGWAAGNTITGQTSTETCEIVSVLSTTTYLVKDRSGTFTLGEILTNGTATADQGAAKPTFAPSGEERRTITSHVGSVINLNYKMINLADNNTVMVYPGCDGRVETCRDTFDNEANFLGFPFIPEENPATRIP